MSERYALVLHQTGRAVAAVTRARGLWAKGVGLLGRSALPPGEGLWLPGVASIHTVGMRFALDVLFLDADGRTVRAALGVKPGRLWLGARGAAQTVELSAGTLTEGVIVGAPWKFVHRDDL